MVEAFVAGFVTAAIIEAAVTQTSFSINIKDMATDLRCNYVMFLYGK